MLIYQITLILNEGILSALKSVLVLQSVAGANSSQSNWVIVKSDSMINLLDQCRFDST